MTVRDATVRIAANCYDILAFIQALALKAPRVLAAPLLMQADKRATSWFHQWAKIDLKQQVTLQNTAPQDHSGLTGVLSEDETRLQN